MNEGWMNGISPYVRGARRMKSSSLSGEWIDGDHVYTYIDQGKAEFILNGVKYDVQEGDVLLMHPLMPHIIKSASTVPLVQYIVHLDLYYDERRSILDRDSESNAGGKSWQTDNREMQLASIHPISHLPLPDRVELKRKFTVMEKELEHPSSGGILAIKSACLELLYLFFKNQTPTHMRKGSMTKGWPMLERAIRFMHDRYRDPQLNIGFISGHIGITANHLSYLFKTQLGVTFYNYLKHVRIEQAKFRIIEGRHNLTEIAEDIGFSSIHLFSRTFKRIVGVTPSEFAATQSDFHVQDRLWARQDMPQGYST
ncbi:AraC family transcriptional regulator [Cohnella yongneupensis]|uniref:AraC family transcriptional regulator n=1 Tax=Cohnella yongneupensis TaxID=425006 RepID=A0ABW0QZE7_9BACL